MSPPESATAVDVEGRYRMHGRLSAAVLGTYVFLLLIIVLVVGRDNALGYRWVTYLLVAVTLLLLARYLSVGYSIDDSNLVARTLFGSRRIALEDVRAIEYMNLRDLSPTGGFLGLWAWSGRMFSPELGEFELVFTEAARGLLVTSGAFPLYISPRDPVAFARELSRRVRSYTGTLLKDAGYPSPAEAATSPGQSGDFGLHP